MSQATAVPEIYGAIRDIPDFPKPGILFKDITPLLLDAALFRRAIDLMAAPFRASGVTRVV
ncbi:MAG: adenine phosphoribosyltransferase, partial [Gemmatimonadetes bacterium]